MKLTDGVHCLVVVGDKSYIKIIRSATALTQACELAARLRIGYPDQRFKIVEPRFCVHGCCILKERLIYIIGDFSRELLRHGYSECNRNKKGVSLV